MKVHGSILKWLYQQFFFCSIVDVFFIGTNSNYFIGKFISLVIIIVAIPLIFYGYKLISKRAILLVDILTFYIAIIASQLAFYHILDLQPLPSVYSNIGLIGTFVVLVLYMILTLLPLTNFLFKDPITNKYGINGHK